MKLYRFFKQASYFNRWTAHPLDAPKLLKLFLKDVVDAAVQTDISTFVADIKLEQIENAAAWYSTNHSKEPNRVFAVVVESSDLDSAGIQYLRSEKGGSGVKVVDARHYDLQGTRTQFLELLKLTLARLMEGEHVVRVYTRTQIQIQLETFACSSGDAFHKGAKSRVEQALGQIDLQSLIKDYDQRTARVELKDGRESHMIDVARPQ